MGKEKINVAILGASGYTGAELLRLLKAHPQARVAALSADSQAGKPIGDVYPHLAFEGLPDLLPLDNIDYKDIDLVFCALPHGTTQTVIAGLPGHIKVIDLSADFRLRDVDAYAQWYGHAHQAQALQKEAVYGLTEHARQAVKEARLVANPGCYPTSALLPLIPLLQQKLIAAEGIIIDAKSGVTGAGRAAKQSNLFTELNDNASAYGVGKHRHTPEIEQELGKACGHSVQISFTPHLLPMSRGMLSTIYVALAEKAAAADLRAALQKAYGSEPFVQVVPEGVFPLTAQVRGTNQCVIGVFEDRVRGRAILVSVIDNLVKGASGQAVQNMNVMFGWPERTALEGLALFP